MTLRWWLSASRFKESGGSQTGSQRGANAGRRQATPGDVPRRWCRSGGSSGDSQRRPATVKFHLKSGRSAVRPCPWPHITEQRKRSLTCGNSPQWQPVRLARSCPPNRPHDRRRPSAAARRLHGANRLVFRCLRGGISGSRMVCEPICAWLSRGLRPGWSSHHRHRIPRQPRRSSSYRPRPHEA